jgi:hypothetical protein
MRLSAPEKPPDDINFGTLPTQVYFYNPNPAMPKIIFAPRWTHQGQCPYIAFTTADEIATTAVSKTIPDEMIFTMRVQVVRERRGFFEVPPGALPPPQGTEVFFVPTIERVCGEYGIQTKALFDELEKLWPTIKFSLPGSTNDWIRALEPVDWPLVPEEFPPWDVPDAGIYDAPNYDTTISNVYRA